VEVDTEHMHVQCDNEICHGHPESRTQPEELRCSLEAPLLSSEAPGTCSSAIRKMLSCNTVEAITLPQCMQSLCHAPCMGLHIILFCS
jgi:hypothetical protein